MRILKYYLFISLLIVSCFNDKSEKTEENVDNAITNIPYQLLGTIPHDVNSFTEGLEFYKGVLYESAAFLDRLPNTASSIGIVDLSTGDIEKKVILNKDVYFSEGITILHDKIYHVTYKNKTGFVFDVNTFKKVREFTYSNTEGWGLTNDGTNIIMSDGTNKLTYFDPITFKVEKTVNVTENGIKKGNLNELEYINGYIYANIWLKDQIVKIDPKSGYVVNIIDCSNLKMDATNRYAGALETNGIAFNKVDSTILITGKMWPVYYKVKFPI